MYSGADDLSTVDIEKESSPQIWSKDQNIIKTHLNITILGDNESVGEIFE